MSIDPKAEALLRKNETVMLDLRSYAAECWTTLAFLPGHPLQNKKRYECSTLLAIKPNLMRYEGWELQKNALTQKLERTKSSPMYIFTCDGKKAARQYGDTYSITDKVGPQYQTTLLEPWGGFFSNSSTLKSFLDSARREGGSVHTLDLLPSEDFEGALCAVVSYHFVYGTGEASQEYKGRVFLDKEGIIRRRVEEIRFAGSPGFTRDAVIRKVRKNLPAPPLSVFAYTPPPGVKPKSERKSPPLLTNGTLAPDFTVLDTTDKPVRLSDFKNKVVVLDFWATWCGPCIKAMPGTNRVARELKDKNVVVIGVNVGETRDVYNAWVAKNQSTYESMLFVRDPAGDDDSKRISSTLYNVTGIPTQYVIDRKGIVRASFVGFNSDEAPLRNAIEAASKL